MFMGRIVFDVGETKYEIEKDDTEILKYFQTITGIKIVRSNIKDLAKEPDSKAIAPSALTGRRLFNDNQMPDKEEIAMYILEHIDGFTISMALDHFYGEVPRYGVSDEQDRLLGKFSGRLKRARELIEEQENGKFVREHKSGIEYYVLKKGESIQMIADKKEIESQEDSKLSQETNDKGWLDDFLTNAEEKLEDNSK